MWFCKKGFGDLLWGVEEQIVWENLHLDEINMSQKGTEEGPPMLSV